MIIMANEYHKLKQRFIIFDPRRFDSRFIWVNRMESCFSNQLSHWYAFESLIAMLIDYGWANEH